MISCTGNIPIDAMHKWLSIATAAPNPLEMGSIMYIISSFKNKNFLLNFFKKSRPIYSLEQLIFDLSEGLTIHLQKASISR